MCVRDIVPDDPAVAEAGHTAADWNAGSTSVNLRPASMMAAPGRGGPGDDSHMTTWARVAEMILRHAAEIKPRKQRESVRGAC